MPAAPSRPTAVTVLAGWTLFVWATRIGNVWRDGDLEVGQKLGRTGLAASFTVLAVVVLVAVVQRRRRLPTAVLALAGWTTAVWVVRATRIVLADHEGAFKVVHVVLAVVSIGLSALAARAVRRAPAGSLPASARA